MTHDDAVRLLEDAISSTAGLATLTTAPTDEQLNALGALRAEGPASASVCAELDLEAGATWGDVRDAIAEDAGLVPVHQHDGRWTYGPDHDDGKLVFQRD